MMAATDTLFYTRKAEPFDFLRLCELGSDFYAEGQIPGRFVPRVFSDSWTQLINAGIGEIWVLVRDESICGAIGFIATKDPCDGEMVASELFWFMDRTARGRGTVLLDKFEERAAQLGCKRMLMVHLASLRGETLSHFYQRRGYKLLESHFIKEVI